MWLIFLCFGQFFRVIGIGRVNLGLIVMIDDLNGDVDGDVDCCFSQVGLVGVIVRGMVICLLWEVGINKVVGVLVLCW